MIEHWTLSQTVNFKFHDKLPVNSEMTIVSSTILTPQFTHRWYNYLNYNTLTCNDDLINPGIVNYFKTFFNLDRSVDRMAVETLYPG